MDITTILIRLKKEFEDTITTAVFNGERYSNGQKAKERLIRSQKIIHYIHEYVKKEFILNGIDKNLLYPPLGSSAPEKKIQGFLKTKNQDITYVPLDVNLEKNINVEKCLVVNIRSQLSSMQKNIDTLYERTFAESLNLHLQYPSMCLGEIYMIPAYEYDDKAMENNQIKFKGVSKIERYIEMFYAIADRATPQGDEYKYERIALLIVDFKQANPKIYYSVEELISDGLISPTTKITDNMLGKISIKGFVKDLIAIYQQRFPC